MKEFWNKFMDKLDNLASIGILIALILYLYAILASEISGVRMDLVFLLAEVVLAISILFIVVCFVSTIVGIVKYFKNSSKDKEKKE